MTNIMAFSLTKIEVQDLQAAERFYTGALGLEVRGRVEFGEGERLMHELILGVPGSRPPAPSFILISYPNKACPAPGEATVGFMVEDMEAAMDKAIAAGATIEIHPIDVPEHGLRLAFLLDPQGHRIELLQQLKG